MRFTVTMNDRYIKNILVSTFENRDKCNLYYINMNKLKSKELIEAVC